MLIVTRVDGGEVDLRNFLLESAIPLEQGTHRVDDIRSQGGRGALSPFFCRDGLNSLMLRGTYAVAVDYGAPHRLGKQEGVELCILL